MFVAAAEAYVHVVTHFIQVRAVFSSSCCGINCIRKKLAQQGGTSLCLSLVLFSILGSAPRQVKVKIALSCPTLCRPQGLDSPWNSPGQNTGVGSFSLLLGIFPTQGSNPGFQYCRWSLYQLSHKGSPRILEWVAYPFSSGSSHPRNRTGVLLTELSGKSSQNQS